MTSELQKELQEELENRVQNGATFLDLHVPGWRNKINLEELDIGNCSNCILGQIYGRCQTGYNKLKIDIMNYEEIPLGFDILCTDKFEKDSLTEAWIKYLKQSVQTAEPQSVQKEQKSLVHA